MCRFPLLRRSGILHRNEGVAITCHVMNHCRRTEFPVILLWSSHYRPKPAQKASMENSFPHAIKIPNNLAFLARIEYHKCKLSIAKVKSLLLQRSNILKPWSNFYWINWDSLLRMDDEVTSNKSIIVIIQHILSSKNLMKWIIVTIAFNHISTEFWSLRL